MTDKLKNTLNNLFANGTTHFLSYVDINKVGRENGLTFAQIKEVFMPDKFKVGRGRFDITPLLNDDNIPDIGNRKHKLPTAKVQKAIKTSVVPQAFELSANQSKPTLTSISNSDVFVPANDSTFVAWGEYKNIKKIIESRLFFPVYISGLSGSGKSLMVEQCCAKLNREYVRLQITPETDNDSIVGGFRLINGETVLHKGPLVKAMEAGAILVVDECDRGSHKAFFSLQGALEGKPIMIPQTGEIIYPTPGFNIIATANTKGRGSDDGRYTAATIIDEAFLERFVVTIDQPYPNFKIERNILAKHFEAYGVTDEEFADKLVSWSSVIRKTYADEGVDELISTRRLCHIAKAYSVFEDRLTAISMCIARFEIEVREAFLDLYQKIDANLIKADDVETSEPIMETNATTDNVPF